MACEPDATVSVVPSLNRIMKLDQVNVIEVVVEVYDRMLAVVPTTVEGKDPTVALKPGFVESIALLVRAVFSTRPNVVPSFKLS